MNTTELTKVTFRKSGKAHRGIRRPDGRVHAACSCPGSVNGSLTKGAQVLAEGWEKANCGH